MAIHDTERSDSSNRADGGRRRERLMALALECASTPITLIVAELGVRFLYRGASTTGGDPVSRWARRRRRAAGADSLASASGSDRVR